MKFEVFLALLLPLLAAGCVTKAQADAQARAAFVAGQEHERRLHAQQQLQQPQPPQQPTAETAQTVRILGPVTNPVLPWRPDLTLAQAILDAGYAGKADPTDILVVRNGQATRVEVNKLLNGRDIPLLPGDIVQLK